MELLSASIDVFLHLDRHLGSAIQSYGTWTYLILFLIVFCETGLVVTPFLPGDSLLFVAGTFAAVGALDIKSTFILISVAAVAGNMLNYRIGYFVGPKVFYKENVRFLNKSYLERTRRFYDKYGAITILVARFMPIIRTFAPFLAGVGRMNYWRFSVYNLAGSLAWSIFFIGGGYYFGNIPAVRDNFSLAIIGVVLISILPGIIAYLRRRQAAGR